MALITIDPDKCKRDGICAAVCPARIIQTPSETQLPTILAEDEIYCITCGHCVAVCPHAALAHQVMAPEACPALVPENLVNPDHLDHLIQARRSIRTYKERPVARDTLERLIRTVNYGPAGHNIRPLHWLVIDQREQVRELAGHVADWMRDLTQTNPTLADFLHVERVIAAWDAGTDRILRDAPQLIVVHADKTVPTAAPTATIAIAYLELAAFSAGLGTCWAGYFQAAANLWPPLRNALELPSGHITLGGLMVGYPKFRYKRVPTRKAPIIEWR